MDDVTTITEVLKSHIGDLEKIVRLLKRVVSNASYVEDGPSKVKVPDPKAYNRTQSAKKLENFLWNIEQYFLAARVPEAERVTITSMYLKGDAKLWWWSWL